jgi:hypothetical protein
VVLEEDLIVPTCLLTDAQRVGRTSPAGQSVDKQVSLLAADDGGRI